MRLILIHSILFLLFSCSDKPNVKNERVPIEEKRMNQTQSQPQNKTSNKQKPQSNFTYFTHLQPEGWGYRISEKGKQIIDQQSIPGIPGNQGFRTSEEAKKVAELVIEKLEKGSFPPTISEEELQKLGISWRN
jgi:hypothetical protein